MICQSSSAQDARTFQSNKDFELHSPKLIAKSLWKWMVFQTFFLSILDGVTFQLLCLWVFREGNRVTGLPSPRWPVNTVELMMLNGAGLLIPTCKGGFIWVNVGKYTSPIEHLRICYICIVIKNQLQMTSGHPDITSFVTLAAWYPEKVHSLLRLLTRLEFHTGTWSFSKGQMDKTTKKTNNSQHLQVGVPLKPQGIVNFSTR